MQGKPVRLLAAASGCLTRHVNICSKEFMSRQEHSRPLIVVFCRENVIYLQTVIPKNRFAKLMSNLTLICGGGVVRIFTIQLRVLLQTVDRLATQTTKRLTTCTGYHLRARKLVLKLPADSSGAHLRTHTRQTTNGVDVVRVSKWLLQLASSLGGDTHKHPPTDHKPNHQVLVSQASLKPGTTRSSTTAANAHQAHTGIM